MKRRAKLADDMQKVEDSRIGQKYLKVDSPYESKKEYNTAYYERNREKLVERQHVRNQERTEIQKYIRAHPEVVERLRVGVTK